MKNRQLYIFCFLVFLSIFREGDLVLAQAAQKSQVFIDTDGLSYITGEQVWCSIRITDSVSGKPTAAGHMIYGSLLDDKGTALIQVRFAAENGIATGFIPLPANLVSGIYLVTAITGDPSVSSAMSPHPGDQSQ